MPPNYEELRACFLDNETRLGRPATELENGTYRGKPVFIIQDTRIYDNRLVNASEELEEFAALVDDPRLMLISKKITELTKPKFDKRTSPQFSSIEHQPDRLFRKLYGTIDFVKDAGAAYIGIAFRKSSYEWSHNHEKALIKHKLWEMFTLKQIMKEMSVHGAKTVIYVHPHAPKEGLKFSKENNVNYVNINPQSNSYYNEKIINLREFFSEYSLNEQLTYPFDYYLKARREQAQEYQLDRTLIISPDLGAMNATKEFAKRNNLNCVCSLKERADEGQSAISCSEEINNYLEELKEKEPDAIITFIIIDDKINTANTANNEALLRKKQIEEYNSKNKTNFIPKIELWCTHFRNPYVFNLKHDNLSKIVVLNTVPYIPSLEEQLKHRGLFDKFRILKGASYQVALGIALDYELCAKHKLVQTELN